MRDVAIGGPRAVVRGTVVLVWVLLASVVVAGCAGIPTSGPVLEGRSGEQEAPEFRAIAPPPRSGATPQEIVRGFLLAAGAPAAASSQGREFATAREYLSGERARGWRPDAGATVFSGQQPDLAVVADGRAVPTGSPVGPEVRRVRVTGEVSVVATIDAAGRYTQVSPPRERAVEFTLVRREGQWRIDQLDDGLLVAESLLGLVYRSYDLFFLDPSLRVLVPETRWFLNRESNPTSLTRELLAGPSPWLQGAVRTSIPVGTELARPASVRVEDGVALVDLSARALRTEPAQRALMLAQLRATLLPVPDVDAVTITVEGAEIDVPLAAATPLSDPGVDVSPVLLLDGRLVRLLPGEVVTPVEGLPDLSAVGPSDPAAAYEGNATRYAVLVQQRSQLLVLEPRPDADLPDPALVGADLTAPSFDRFGWVWSTSAVSTGVVSAVAEEGHEVEVAAPWLAGRRVSSLRVSRDGARVVVASTDAAGAAHVDVAGVVRDDKLTPLSLSPEGPLPVGARLTEVREAVWVDDTSVAALGRAPTEEATGVYVLRIGGREGSALAPIPTSVAVDLAAGAGEGTLLVATEEGTILERAGAAWLPVRELQGARDPAFTG